MVGAANLDTSRGRYQGDQVVRAGLDALTAAGAEVFIDIGDSVFDGNGVEDTDFGAVAQTEAAFGADLVSAVELF